MATLDTRMPAEAGGALDGRLGGDDQSMEGLRRRLAEAEGAPDKTGLGVLGSPESLIKLGLAAIAGLSGNPNLQSLGAGLGMGTLSSAPGHAAAANQAREQGIDKLVGRIQKLEQNLIQMYSADPKAFTTTEGENILTRDDWSMLTGIDAPINPSALRQGVAYDQRQRAKLELMGSMLEQSIAAGKPELVRHFANRIGELVGIDLDDVTIEELARTQDFREIITALVNSPNVDTMSVLETVRAAANNVENSGIFHPDNFQIRPADPVSALHPIKDAEAIALVEAMDMVRRRWAEMTPEERIPYMQDPDGTMTLWDEVLSNSPVHKEVAFSKLLFLRRGEEARKIGLEASMAMLTDVMNFERWPMIGEIMGRDITPERRAQLIAQAIGSRINDVMAVSQQLDLGRVARVLSNLPNEELAAEHQRLGWLQQGVDPETVDAESITETIVPDPVFEIPIPMPVSPGMTRRIIMSPGAPFIVETPATKADRVAEGVAAVVDVAGQALEAQVGLSKAIGEGVVGAGSAIVGAQRDVGRALVRGATNMQEALARRRNERRTEDERRFQQWLSAEKLRREVEGERKITPAVERRLRNEFMSALQGQEQE